MKDKLFLKKELLKILLNASNNTLQAYTANKRMGISTNVFFSLIFELENEKYIAIDGAFIRLLDLGVKQILTIIDHENNNKSKIPEKFISETKVSVNQFYIPKRSLL